MSLFSFCIGDLEEVLQLGGRAEPQWETCYQVKIDLGWKLWFRAELRLLVTAVKYTHPADVW